MEAKVFQSIDEIDQEVWDSLLSENQIMKSHAYLNAVEKSNLEECKFWYMLFYNENKVVGATAIFSMYGNIEETASQWVKDGVYFVRRMYKNFFRFKIIGCGTPTATCSNVILCDEKDSKEVIENIEKVMRGIAKKEKAHLLMFRDFDEHEVQKMQVLEPLRYIKTPTLPTSFMDVKWDCFEDYLTSIKGKVRVKMKRIMRHIEFSDVEFVIADDYGHYSKEMYELYSNVYAKAQSKFEKLTPEYFENINTYLKGKSKVIFVKRKDEIIAFEIVLLDETVLRPIYVGINYKYNDEYSLYFNLLYKIMAFGIDLNKEIVELGQTCYYPKQKMGARVEGLYMYMRFRNKMIHGIFSIAKQFLFPEIKLQRKNIFKNNSTV